MKVREPNLIWQDIDMLQLDLIKLILHFEQSNKADAKSPKAAAWYTEILTNFVKFQNSSSRDAVLSEFNVTTFGVFIIHEQDRGISTYKV